MDCGIFFMKDHDSLEEIKGFWYKSLLPISDDSKAKIFYIPLHQKYFSIDGVTQDKLKDFKLELYSVKEPTLCNEFKYILFEHLSNNEKIEHLFFNVIKDFLETFYKSDLTEFLSIFSKQEYEISEISLMIDKNIRKILNKCLEIGILSNKDVINIQYLENEKTTEELFLKKFFKKIIL